MRIAVCPGSFDPITVGHLDLAERAAAIFDRVILCVMVNGEKKHMFTLDERLELARAAAAHLPNVEAAAACWRISPGSRGPAPLSRASGAARIWIGKCSWPRSTGTSFPGWTPSCCPPGLNTCTSAPQWCGKCSATSRD